MVLETGGGILHLGGRERVSRYDLGMILAEMLGADAGLILPLRQRDRTVGAPRPPHVSPDSSRAYARGYNPPSLREELAAFLRGHGTPRRRSAGMEKGRGTDGRPESMRLFHNAADMEGDV